jgi:hypothetical protein
MNGLGFDPIDRLFKPAMEAYSAMHALSVEIKLRAVDCSAFVSII